MKFIVMVELQAVGTDDASGIVISTHHSIDAADSGLIRARRRLLGVPSQLPRPIVRWRLLGDDQKWVPGDPITLRNGHPLPKARAPKKASIAGEAA